MKQLYYGYLVMSRLMAKDDEEKPITHFLLRNSLYSRNIHWEKFFKWKYRKDLVKLINILEDHLCVSVPQLCIVSNISGTYVSATYMWVKYNIYKIWTVKLMCNEAIDSMLWIDAYPYHIQAINWYLVNGMFMIDGGIE